VAGPAAGRTAIAALPLDRLLAGRLYGAGDELAAEHDRIEALAAAARSRAARQAGRLVLISPPASPSGSPDQAWSLP